MIDPEKKELAGWWLWIVGLMVVTVIVFTGLSYFGVIGKTVVERKVFEQSYQRSEALRSAIATDEAAVIEIDAKLANPNLDENTRYNLKAQKGAAQARIRVAKMKQRWRGKKWNSLSLL